VVADRGLADEEAVDHEQPDRVAAAHERAARAPRAARDVDGTRQQARRHLADTARIEAPGKLRVCLEKLYGSVPALSHP
jgi:predicted  nucleic acid-binding Zn-ribbon protein